MKNIAYKLKFLIIAVLAISVSSCDALLDEEVTDYGTGPNFVGFSAATLTINAETNGEEFSRMVPLRIIGPTVTSLNDEVVVTVSVDPSSTAIEGVHYRLDSNTVTLRPSESDTDVFAGGLPITILTEGLEAPLATAPILVLNITSAESNDNIVINDKTKRARVTLSYACPFDTANYEGTWIATSVDFPRVYLNGIVPFEIVAGPGENQITLINPAAHPEGYDIIVDVNPANGNLTIARQPFLNYNSFNVTQYGELRIEGTGTSGPAAGECFGQFSINTGYFVDAGTFGEFGMSFVRVAGEDEDEDEDEDEG